MGFLKNYIAPSKKKGSAASEKTAVAESSTASQPGVPPSMPPSGWATPRGSRPASIYPQGDFRNSAMDELIDIKCDVMVNWLHQQQLESMWSSGSAGEGVILKKSRGEFTACPPDLRHYQGDFYDAVRALNVRSAITVNTRVIKLFMGRNEAAYMPLKNGLQLQILPSITALPNCQKHHFAAFIHDSQLLVVWDDDPRHLLQRAKDIEKELLEMIWEFDEASAVDEKKGGAGTTVNELPLNADGELDTEALAGPPRRVMLEVAVMSGLVMVILFAAVGAGWRQISQEIAIDGSMLRVAFAAVVPLQLWMALFFMQAVIGNLLQIFGPTNQLNENSKFYSGKRPERLHSHLPHVTIQMPVYKEGLKAVIEPTIMSMKAAISTYEMQGGSANIFVNEDGMQIIPPDEAQARKDFYDEHNIGWVARPKHVSKPKEGETKFIRAGKFKKASNMNYGMAVSARIEDKLAQIQRPEGWTYDDEMSAYDAALQEVISEDEGRTWAEGNIRMGDYILLIDSDTRVPTDCFLDAVSEMEQSPQVAILQFSSGVMNITTSFFEKGITFFTNLIYTAIANAVASGDVAPFVGHNAILRWSAVQSVAYAVGDEAEKYWSEDTVSEDFDMALRLQTAGYIVRFATYMGDGFKEGVSLTVYDELMRWEKYAYGCSELLFHPLRYWFVRGPFTKLFRNFIGSCMPLPSKLTIMAYIGTYYAIASAWCLTLLNYFVIGWFNGYYDHYYIDSFSIFIAIIVVFTALGNIALAVLRYRVYGDSILAGLWLNFKWVPMLAVFLGGVSLHVSQAILSHLFSVNIEWGATAKEAEDTTFFKEVPKLLRKFRWTFVFCFLMTGMMIALAVAAPPLWRIGDFVAIFPLALLVFWHFLLPVALNPSLMMFTW